METPAAAAPAGGFFPSFLLLAFGTLVAAVLGAAHRLGLFYQLMHKVLRAGGGLGVRRRGLKVLLQLIRCAGGESESQLVQSDWLGGCLQSSVPLPICIWAWTL